MVFYFVTESLKSNNPCIKKDLYIILTCFRTMLMNVRQYIFNLQRLCSTEETTTRTNILSFFFSFYCKLWMDRKQNSNTLWLMYTDISFVKLKMWNSYFIFDIKVFVQKDMKYIRIIALLYKIFVWYKWPIFFWGHL